ncbi:MAG TPA: primosomal protein N' [Candidatus Omnitrophota bacterium]|nr:primosomal protein N' [Candidatus Omnitrophota bacterium]
MSRSTLALVAVPLPIATEAFSYLIPEELLPRVIPGVRVNVPFANREITGYVVSIVPDEADAGPGSPVPEKPKTGSGDRVPVTRLKSILSVLDSQPVLSGSMLQLTKWVGEYYGCSWGEAIENALPRWVKYGKKTEKYIEKAQRKSVAEVPRPPDFTLSSEQKKAFEIIQKSLEAGGRKEDGVKKGFTPSAIRHPPSVPILIYGVTGSGKSELYIRAIRETLKRGRGAICMVPEIALTEQLQRFFAGQFGGDLEILHSKMTDSERFLTWKRIELGTCRVVLGPRSAVFAPVPDLGLIIMDEEHEGSYKQETAPRYHARDVAAWRARNEGALFLMGTATPSLESMRMTEQGRVTRIDLTQRIDDKAMPKVEVIDLKRYQGDKRASHLFSPPLAREIETNLKNGEGTMLLLNRRGFSTSIRCHACNEVEKCKSCQVSLTFHQEKNLLLCHYCNYQKKVPDTCSSCKAPLLRFMGFGTEKVESEAARLFPGARIARMDADTTKQRDSHERILEQFRERKIDILIGTQMIAKGFDFPHVTLVGVVLADVGLRLPDFRSSERTFQLLTQFAGRAGRGTKPGRVFIQTWMADHPSILCAQRHDFLAFYAHEKVFREEFRYPPYCSLVNIIVRGGDEKKTYQFAREVRDGLRSKTEGSRMAEGGKAGLSSSAILHSPSGAVEIIGPAPLPFYKLRGHFRWHVMLKLPLAAPDGTMGMKDRIGEIYRTLMKLKKPSGVAFQIDVDPLNIL